MPFLYIFAVDQTNHTMKNLLAALTVLLTVNVWAQDQAGAVGKTYIAVTSVLAKPINYPQQTTAKNAQGDTLVVLPRGTLFDVIGINNQGSAYIIELRPTKDKKEEGHSKAAPNISKGIDFVKRNYGNGYMLLAITELNKIKEFRAENGFTLGSSVMPFKLRPGYGHLGEFEFATDVALNALFGYKFSLNRYNPWFVTPTLGTGISMVQVDSGSTFGKMTEGQNLAGFSLSLGCLFEFNKIQVGVFMGSDLLSKNSKYDWVNQGRPWFSVGIGYQLFTVSNPGDTRQNKQP